MPYWQIGQEILHRQKKEGWGTRVIERFAKDWKQEFPKIRGFSRSNLMYIRALLSHTLINKLPYEL